MSSSPTDFDQFETLEAHEHEDQREPHDRPQFNRAQMRMTIFHGKRIATEAFAQAVVRFGPCEHCWAYAPTVGNLSCLHCGQRREHDHSTTIAYRAALPGETA